MVTNLLNSLRIKILGKRYMSTDKGQDIIVEELLSDKPSMIARYGSTEIKAVLYPKMSVLKNPLRNRIINNMHILSGFFPPEEAEINRFSKLMIDDIQELDVLGSWRIEEVFLKKHMSKTTFLPLRCLEPYYFDNPWSRVLEGKRVLVVHPFSETIELQYNTKRELLFKNPNVLPKFKSLQTIKAVQTIAGNNQNGFKTWFDALDYMKAEIDKKDFDIAILGCGAYGFPLAAYIKRKGKKAFHLGGATQILFGIKGKRWLDNPDFSNILNEHFVFPLESDTPQNATKVENGCYW